MSIKKQKGVEILMKVFTPRSADWKIEGILISPWRTRKNNDFSEQKKRNSPVQNRKREKSERRQ